jgi:ribonuclease D
VLVTLALERPSESAAALTHLGRFPYARRAVDHFVAAIARGMSATRPEPATDAPRRFERRSPERRRHEEALRRFRAHTAETLAIDPALVLPQRLIDRLTTAAPRRVEDLAQVEGLGRWRIEAFGPDLVTPA